MLSNTRGKDETNRLKSNVQDQLNRLVNQLQDLEETRAELEESEYVEIKQETIAQMRDFQKTLAKAMAGDITLVDEFGSIQLAIQAAVSDAFKTPEVIAMFAKKQPQLLRERLANLKRDVKLYKLPQEHFTQQAVEILTALKRLGETLSGEESAFLAQNMTASLSEFEKVEADIGAGTKQAVLSVAGNQIKHAKGK